MMQPVVCLFGQQQPLENPHMKLWLSGQGADPGRWGTSARVPAQIQLCCACCLTAELVLTGWSDAAIATPAAYAICAEHGIHLKILRVASAGHVAPD